METKLQLIHEEMCKLQCSHSFITAPEIDETIREDVREEIKQSYDYILSKISDFQKDAFKLDNKPKLNEFEFVDQYFIDILASFDKVHQSVGAAISQYLGAKMMKTIMNCNKIEETKDS